MGARLMAIVAEGDRGRVYLAADARAWRRLRSRRSRRGSRMLRAAGHGRVTRQGTTLWFDDVRRLLHPPPARGADDLLRPGAGSARAGKARRPCRRPARRRQASARRRHRRHSIRRCGGGVSWRSRSSKADRLLRRICPLEYAWRQRSRNTFGRQALPMIWDYRGSKSFRGRSGDCRCGCRLDREELLDSLPAGLWRHAYQSDAQTQVVSR